MFNITIADRGIEHTEFHHVYNALENRWYTTVRISFDDGRTVTKQVPTEPNIVAHLKVSRETALGLVTKEDVTKGHGR